MTRPPPGARMCTACPASGWSAPAYRRTATQAPVASAAVAATGSPPHSTAWRESRTSMIHTYSVRSYSVLVQLYGRVRLVLATSPVRPVAMYGRTRGIFADSCCRITHPVPAHVSRYPRPSDTSRIAKRKSPMAGWKRLGELYPTMPFGEAVDGGRGGNRYRAAVWENLTSFPRHVTHQGFVHEGL